MDTTGGEMDGNNCLPENPTQRGRKKLKTKEKKTEKKPMRGMGVAKLERLRLTGHQKSPPPILPSASGHHFFLPAPDPTRTAGYGYLDLNNALLLQRLGPYAGLTGGSSDHGPGSAQVRVGFGGIMDVGFRGGSYPGENPKELSSIPNPVRYPADQCCFCHKKTRMNGGSLRCNGMREKYCDPSVINGFSFNGFNGGNKQPIHGSSVDKGEEAAVGIHRNGSSSRAFMEYDFFPPAGKGGRGTCTNDLDLSLFSEASVAALGGGGGAGGGEGSCVTTTTTASASSGFDASTSIDLSLKLYC